MAITRTERLLQRERAILVLGLSAMILLAWIYLLLGAGTGMSALHMTSWRVPLPLAETSTPAAWTPAQAVVALAMWWVMMIAMMLPSAAPVVLLYARVLRHHNRPEGSAGAMVPTASFAAGYLVVWLLFSAAAVCVQFVLEQARLLDAIMLWPTSRWFSGGLLIAAALYQLSPLKSACLGHCRSPVDWLARNWRKGRAGAFRMGAQHGAYCVGCCWALMLMLFAGGVMNIVWVAGLAGLVLVEKLTPWGRAISRWSAVALATAGIITLLSA
jgi:predicted metal-binding membrane protein